MSLCVKVGDCTPREAAGLCQACGYSTTFFNIGWGRILDNIAGKREQITLKSIQELLCCHAAPADMLGPSPCELPHAEALHWPAWMHALGTKHVRVPSSSPLQSSISQTSCHKFDLLGSPRIPTLLAIQEVLLSGDLWFAAPSDAWRGASCVLASWQGPVGQGDEGILHLGIYRCWLFFGTNRCAFLFVVSKLTHTCLSWYVRHAIGISHNTENQYLGVSYNIIAWVKSGMPWQLLSAIQTDNFEHFWMTWEPSIFGLSRHHWPGWKGMPAAQIAAASIARATLGCADEWTMDGNLIIQRTEIGTVEESKRWISKFWQSNKAVKYSLFLDLIIEIGNFQLPSFFTSRYLDVHLTWWIKPTAIET